jgi:glycosyltransferase involved in cell wall biosynthesis
MNRPKYFVITPVRDEANNITKTIDSMVNQTILPKEWIIINDGSIDSTPQIINSASKNFDWIKVVHRSNRGYRKPGGGVIEAFYDGYNKSTTTEWDFLVKLDGDLSFSYHYFEKCLEYFFKDPKLGIGGGAVYQRENDRLVIDSKGDPPFHVRGATKIYRKSCWQQIEPLVKYPGWDTIDEVRANMLGWRTYTFKDIKIIQHKPTGSADGTVPNWKKNGLANYITGYHPIFMIAKCIKRAFERPFLVASASLLAGFCHGYLMRIPQMGGRDAIRYLRQQQLRRLLMLSSIYNSF